MRARASTKSLYGQDFALYKSFYYYAYEIQSSEMNEIKLQNINSPDCSAALQ